MAVLETIIGPIASIIDKIIPDKEARMRAKLELLALEGSEVTQVAVSLDALLNLTDGDNTLTVTGDSGDKVLLLGDGWVQGADTVVNGTAAETFSNGGAIVIVEEELDVLSNYSNILPDNF